MVITTLDQGASSASNFVVGVAAARLAGARGLGGFSFGYVCWQLVVVLHRSLVTDPMAIENDAHQPDASVRLRQGFAADLTIGVSSAVVFALAGAVLLLAGEAEFGLGLVAFAPWLVFLVLQDYWRWVGFMQKRPAKALANDIVFNAVFGIALAVVILAHWHSVPALIATWGVGGLAGALFGIWQFSVRPMFQSGLTTLRSRLHFSKWIAGNQASVWGASQATSLVVGFVLGPIGLGYMRAAQTLVYGPTLVLTQASGSIGLPEASSSLARNGWPGLRRVARVVTAAAFLSVSAVAIVVLLFGRDLLRIVYGHPFAHYWLSSDLFAASVLIGAMGVGPMLILKASRRTRPLFAVSVIATLFSLAAVVVLARTYGVEGAAGAACVSEFCYLVAILGFKRLARIRLTESAQPVLATTTALVRPASSEAPTD